jgi:hypothetical protein
MAVADRSSEPEVSASSLSPRFLLSVFAAAIFLSAALLFAVQPLFAKIVLPRLGGSPAVWSVAMVFFQTVLLAGYAYAHALTRLLPGRPSVFVHLAVMAIATISLPLSIAAGFGRPPAEAQAFWLFALFAVSIGLPFFALSANGPLLQAWFARSSHPAARDPYFLYAASNVGSFLALLAYPFVIEPFSRLGQQTGGWSVGFYALIALIAVCGVLMLRSPGQGALVEERQAPAPTWREVAIWIGFAAVPSGMLIAVTAHISTDVAATPFLWVVPLALYLATFVIAFQTRPVLPHRFMVAIHPAAIVLIVAWYAIEPSGEIFTVLVVNILAFFVIAMVCHGELARRRPPVQHLTAFYLWLSFGGVVGGFLTGMMAMQIFNWVIEFPVLIAFAALCRPGLTRPRGALDWTVIGLAAVAAAIMFAGANGWRYEMEARWFDAIAWSLLAAAFLLQWRVLPFAALIALALVFAALYGADSGPRDFVRSFFGVHKVMDSDDGQFRVLKHGIIEHGAQRIRDAQGRPLTGRPEVLTYYFDESPLNEGIVAVRERRKGPVRIAVVGLGTGSLACQTKPGDTLRYYEIDPAVERIARDPNRFTYISACMPGVPVTIGDARLTLEDAADGAYDVLVVDAFSSDAIPTHLLTREAMAIYLRKIAADGVVLMHVTNRHMTLAPVVAGVAHANGLVARTRDTDDFDDQERKYASTVVAVARSHDHMGSLAQSEDWPEEQPDPSDWVWTDDYSNVIGAMFRHWRQR